MLHITAYMVGQLISKVREDDLLASYVKDNLINVAKAQFRHCSDLFEDLQSAAGNR